MEINFAFLFNSILLGFGLAMDAFSVSLANGLNEPNMKKRKMCFVAGIFAFFQALMPILGWVCVHTLLGYFKEFEKFIPWIALLLLGFIGGKMLYEGVKGNAEETKPHCIGFCGLLVQGIATSIDALSVGFTIADYNPLFAILAALIIAVVTFIVCFSGIIIGQRAGTKLAGKSGILGGAILMIIGIEIFITGII